VFRGKEMMQGVSGDIGEGEVLAVERWASSVPVYDTREEVWSVRDPSVGLALFTLFCSQNTKR
jgi:hypothetical protein